MSGEIKMADLKCKETVDSLVLGGGGYAMAALEEGNLADMTSSDSAVC
jgi:hypothetical protein